MRPTHPDQFDLFPDPKKEHTEGQQPSPSDDGGELMPLSDETYHPTDEDEQARLEMEHGPGVQYVPPKSRAEREADKLAIRRLIDRTLRKLGGTPRDPQGELFDDDDAT